MSIKFSSYGGLSRGDSRGKEGSYIYGEAVDNISNPECLQVGKKPENIFNSNKEIEKILYIPKFNKIIYFVGRYIYELGSDIPLFEFGKLPFDNNDYTEIIDDQNILTSKKIYLTAYFDSYYLYIVSRNFKEYQVNTRLRLETKNRTYKIYLESLFSRNYKLRINEGFVWSYFFSGLGAQSFLSVGESNFVVSNSGDSGGLWNLEALKDGYTRNFGNEKAITGNGNGYRIYTDNRLLLWDGKNENSHNSLYEMGISIERVVSKNGTDYLFAKEGLFFLNGTIASPLYKTHKSNYYDKTKFDFDFSIMSNFIVSDDLIWCIENNGDEGKKICTFGNREAGYPMSYTIFYIAKNYEKVIYIEKKDKGVLIAYKDKNGTYGIDYYSYHNTQKQDKGFVIHREYIKDSISEVKKSQTMKIYASKLVGSDTIKISYSINNQPFQDFITLNKDTGFKNGLYMINSFNYEFHKVVFKIEITANTKLYDFIFYQK